MTDLQEPTRLMLVIETGDGALERLTAALGVADVPSIVIRAGGGRPLEATAVKPLIAAAQKKGAAVLIEGDARLARTLKADGVHVAVSEKGAVFHAEAREIVGRGAIVGVDAGRSRHDAMAAGEDGADYVGFGIPAFVKDRETAFERQLDLIAWWSEIFEIPAVAFDVASADAVQALAEAGADFVALTLAAGTPPAEAANLVRAAVAALAEPDPAAPAAATQS